MATAVHRLFPNIRPLTVNIHANAIVLARIHKVSFYDALIISAALEARCEVLFSEDLQHEQKFGELEVMNPFR
jgi:predicted nucleic acid-binding protein